MKAAKFQLERNGSVDQARKILIRAQNQNLSNPAVFDQLFRVELVNAAQINKRMEVVGGERETDESNVSKTDLRRGAAAIKAMDRKFYGF